VGGFNLRVLPGEKFRWTCKRRGTWVTLPVRLIAHLNDARRRIEINRTKRAGGLQSQNKGMSDGKNQRITRFVKTLA